MHTQKNIHGDFGQNKTLENPARRKLVREGRLFITQSLEKIIL
jgi:hypothetical protein